MPQWPLVPPPARRLPLEKLKVCPLCDSLNAKHNSECFVCGWSGDFSFDEDRIANALYEVILDCPAIIDLIASPPARRLPFLHRMVSRLRRSRRPIDFEA